MRCAATLVAFTAIVLSASSLVTSTQHKQLVRVRRSPGDGNTYGHPIPPLPKPDQPIPKPDQPIPKPDHPTSKPDHPIPNTYDHPIPSPPIPNTYEHPSPNTYDHPNKDDIINAYGPVPENYKPDFDKDSPVPCTYGPDGWLLCASVPGCPIKIQPPSPNVSPVPGSAPKGDLPFPPNFLPVSAPKVLPTPQNGLPVPAPDALPIPLPNGLPVPAQKDQPKPDKKDDGKTSCTVGGSTDTLINVDLLNCSSLCILSTNCPKIEQNCTIESSQGTLIDVKALDCSAINILSSSN